MESKLLFSGLNCLDCKGFKQLLDTQSLVDCTLACDGGKISAHKLVLSACSSYLARILLDHPVEHPIIILPELNIEDVRTLIHYMYTGELLKSDTINSISLLRTAAILSINSLNDLLLSSNSSSPNSLMSSHQFASANNNHNNNSNNNMNNSNNTICQTALHSLQQDRYSIVEQISPLLAAISQQQQQQQLNQAFATRISNDGNTGSFSMNQNENISRNLSASSHDSISSTNSSNFSSILGAAAAAAVASVSAGGTGSSAVAQLYNSLTGSRPVNSPMTNALNLNSSSSSTSPSPTNNNKPTNFSVPEPFAYSSAITGIVTVANTNTSSNNHDSSNNNSTSSQASSTTNEFQFKCPVCQNHFQTICSFEYHMQRAHSVTSFGCEICHKPFASLRYVLTDHMRRCHGWNGATNTNNNGQTNQSSSNNEREQKLHC